jgi:hypothetical protein
MHLPLPIERVRSPPSNSSRGAIIYDSALSGVEAPENQGLIQGVEMLILIDSGNSHSFISEQVAAVLKEVTAISSSTSQSG